MSRTFPNKKHHDIMMQCVVCHLLLQLCDQRRKRRMKMSDSGMETEDEPLSEEHIMHSLPWLHHASSSSLLCKVDSVNTHTHTHTWRGLRSDEDDEGRGGWSASGGWHGRAERGSLHILRGFGWCSAQEEEEEDDDDDDAGRRRISTQNHRAVLATQRLGKRVVRGADHPRHRERAREEAHPVPDLRLDGPVCAVLQR